jgi:predicted nuclease with TOPRIM domain
VPEVVSESELRLAIINAVLRDVATKEDIAKVVEEIEKVKVATKEDIAGLREEIEKLRKEIYDQITELRERVSKLKGAFTQLVERIGDLDKRIDALDKRIDALDKRIDYVTKVSWALTLSVLATLVTQVLMKVLMPRCTTHQVLRILIQVKVFTSVHVSGF